MTGQLLPILFMGAISVLVALAILSLFRGFLRAMRAVRLEPGEPIRDPNPPERVERTAGLDAVAYTAIAWSVCHVLFLLAWVFIGFLFDRTVYTFVVATYFAVAALITGFGGVLLLRRFPYGRRTVAWGQMLFGLMTFMGFAIAVLTWAYGDAPPSAKRYALPMVAIFAAHMVIDTIIGAAAQQAGRPAEPTGAAPSA